jgi:phage terminase small subunit
MPILSNSKHERFSQGIAQGMTVSAAYEYAGYSAHGSNAARLSQNDNVKARVNEILSAAAERAGITRERIQSELAKIAFADIRKAILWGNGVVIKDEETGAESVVNDVSLIASDKIDDDTAGAISEVSRTKDGMRLKMHDKQRALELLGKDIGMFKEKIEHSGEVTLAGLITKSLEAE